MLELASPQTSTRCLPGWKKSSIDTFCPRNYRIHDQMNTAKQYPSQMQETEVWSVYVCIIENTDDTYSLRNKMDYRNNDSSNYRWVKRMVSYNFSKTNRCTKNSLKRPSQGLWAVFSSSCLLVLVLTLISVNLISKVFQLSSFVVLSHIL